MNLASRLNLELEYKVEDILARLVANKEKHKKEYAEAVKNYNAKVEEKLLSLSALADTVRAGRKFDNLRVIQEAASSVVLLAVPKNAEEMYDQYINILRQTESKTIKLSAEDANAIFNDAWDWAVSASMTNSAYLSR